MENAVEVRPVEVRYAGVVVGRGVLREVRAEDPDGAFVAVPEPLPVGTLLTLKIGDAVREGRVEDIVESSDPNAVGMRVRWRHGAPAPAAKPVPSSAPAPTAAPAREAAPSPPAATAAPAREAAAPAAPASSADSGPTGDSGPATADAGEESDAIPAPLSLAGAGGQSGKRRHKRR